MKWLLALESESQQVLFADHFLFIAGSDDLVLFVFVVLLSVQREAEVRPEQNFLLCVLATQSLQTKLLNDTAAFVDLM